MYSRPENSTRRPPTSLFPFRTASTTRSTGRSYATRAFGSRLIWYWRTNPPRGDLGHAGHGLQGVAQVPVLETAQVGEIVLPAPVHQGVLVNPADGGFVARQLDVHPLRQARQDVRQVLER